MKQTINQYDFERAFVKMGRENQFSHEGRKALFEYLEEYEDETGEDVELDVIALCCDYAEYGSMGEFQEDYGKEYRTAQDIEERTILIPIDKGGFIIQQF